MTSEKKWGFIVNPIAGDGFAGKFVDTIKEKIAQYQLNAELVFTIKKGHASELSAELANNGFSHIIGVGGDGTMNECVKGIIHRDDITFGCVPAGTGNDFIPILGFPKRFTEQDWQILFEENTIKMDVGKCNENYFVNGMGLGFDAQVAAENYKGREQAPKGGSSKYFWHIIKTLFFYKEKDMHIFMNEGDVQTKCFINTVAIGRRFAGGYFLTPKAVANDGLLDVCNIDELSLPHRFKIFLKVPKGQHLSDKKVNYYQTEKLLIEFDIDVPHHLDGELFFAKHFEVSLLPEKLKVIYNPSGEHYFNT
jgi:YegS/Rv2252/BmrU family lipid kinase